MGTAIAVILLLIFINGLFSMSETALVSARRVRLEQMAARGSLGAKAALALSMDPTRFLSTVQVGISLIAILSGAYGEATLRKHFQSWLESVPALAGHAETLSFAIVVLLITYLSVVLGELVPKRLALANPEAISSLAAKPMGVLARIAAPAVWLLSATTNALMRAFGRSPSAHAVTEEDVRGMIEAATETGAVAELEQRIIERVFRLGDRRVKGLMVPRTEIEWLELDAPPELLRRKVAAASHSHFPVCRGGLDRVVGVVHLRDLVRKGMSGGRVDLQSVLRRPLFVPETAPALKMLETMQRSGTRFALVVDEFGALVGLVTLGDIVQAIVGDVLHRGDDAEEPAVVRRPDGSWLVDGGIPLDRLWEVIGLRERPAEVEQGVATVSGLITWKLGHIPAAGEGFELAGHKFEVVDMDRQRVDKVLVTPVVPAGAGGEEGPV